MIRWEVKDVDERFYKERLRDFLPPAIIDVHTHVWLARFQATTATGPKRIVTWPSRVAEDQSVEALIETYRRLLPGKTVTPLIFANALDPTDDVDGSNAYVADCAARHGFPALLFARPQWPADVLEEKVRVGGFLGVKVYLTLADPALPEGEIGIFDFLPPHQLEVLDRRGGIVMLHVPRKGRLRDPVNLTHLLEIEQRYPNLKLIVAHVGRAYCPEDVGNAFEVLSVTRKMCFDISANTNRDVFRQLIDAVGPKRILFGSDLPTTRMRMRRVCENGTYVNVVPRGLYGDVTGDAHMREADGSDAERLTFFLYEEIAAFREAAEAAGLTTADVEDVFYRNAARWIGAASQGRFFGGNKHR